MSTETGIRTAAAALFLSVQAAEDLRFHSVPVFRTLLCAAAAFAADIFCLICGDSNSLTQAEILQAILLSGLLLLPPALSIRGIGAGDGLTWLVLGLLTGPSESLQILLIAGILCSLCGFVMIAAGKADRKTEQPFLVFAAAGFFICCFMGRI